VRTIIESGVRVFGKQLSLLALIEKIVGVVTQNEVGFIPESGENAASIVHRIFSSERARNISVGRDYHLFALMNNVTRYPGISFFLAGNFHAFDMQKRFSEKPNPHVAIVSMKELSDAHRGARKQQEETYRQFLT